MTQLDNDSYGRPVFYEDNGDGTLTYFIDTDLIITVSSTKPLNQIYEISNSMPPAP